jgi:DNA (cytosine-5)-methyltransferase 1
MKCLSLFANVGIGETYFKDIGIDVVVANEYLPDRAEFYQEMHPSSKMICGDITDSSIFNRVIEAAEESAVDLIIATPPCQGMSIANAKRADRSDPRNSLIKQVIRATEKLKPKYVLIENVPGMASEKTFILDDDGNEVNILPHIISQLGGDYKVAHKVLDASEHHTPHYRKRLITLLSRRDCAEWKHPAPSSTVITVKDVIGSFLSLESEQDSPVKWHSMKHKKHNKHHIKWMQHTPTGATAFNNKIYFPKIIDKKTCKMRPISGFKTTYKRMSWNRPAPAVTMMNGSINSQNNVHPGRRDQDGLYSDARVLTIKELCAIIGLPLDWVDHLEHTQRRENFLRKVLGECFPPMMAKSIVANIPNQETKHDYARI